MPVFKYHRYQEMDGYKIRNWSRLGQKDLEFRSKRLGIKSQVRFRKVIRNNIPSEFTFY
ncbi:hypothetical protein DSECCO2_292710 [anaerobic digester metagenome]